ncbi:MAG TPA: SymE family type I addiction module toxin [Steroidobacteraceae bacterium]|nr:SymE family type I addiction module toxin [Steroidobacteraceae bacterium]
MDLRHLTVGYRPVDSHSQAPRPLRSPTRMPFVRLSGRWLERMGFGIGTAVRVHVSRKRLVLEVIEPEASPERPRRRRYRSAAGD